VRWGSSTSNGSPPLAAYVATQPAYHSQRNIGSCALEWAWLAAGRAHFIVHGGQKIWDFAAGSLLASEAGCSVGDFEGAPLFREQQLSSPVIAASNADLHGQLLAYIAAGRAA
jgi:myo-inositol-1(or 4)-monophosphatase